MRKNLSVVELAEKHNTDKKMNNGVKCQNGVLGHNYAIYYDELFKILKVYKLLEIGVSRGSSIKMWDEFFNKSVAIYGIDISEERFKRIDIETNNIKIFIGNQGDEHFLQQFNGENFDLIIDDGSHRMSHQQISLKILFKYLNSGGVYVIEDLQTSKYNRFFDSKNETTTLDVLFSLQKKEKYLSNYMTEDEYNYLIDNVDSIEFYENNTICFIRKK